MSYKNLQINNCLVAFIDILGMRNTVKSIRTQEKLYTVYKKLKFVQHEFGKRIGKDVHETHQISGKKILAFSDCIIISLDFTAPIIKTMGAFDAMMDEIYGMGLSQAICVCDTHVFLRGGIDIGAWYYKKDILISPPLIRAYELENQHTEFPVIALTKNTYQYFKNHPHRANYAPDADPLDIFNKVKRNGKYFYFLDYLSIGYEAAVDWYKPEDLILYRKTKDAEEKNNILSNSYKKSQKAFLNAHKKAVTHGLKASSKKEESIKNKYIWLKDYHDSFIKGLDAFFQDCKINI